VEHSVRRSKKEKNAKNIFSWGMSDLDCTLGGKIGFTALHLSRDTPRGGNMRRGKNAQVPPGVDRINPGDSSEDRETKRTVTSKAVHRTLDLTLVVRAKLFSVIIKWDQYLRWAAAEKY